MTEPREQTEVRRGTAATALSGKGGPGKSFMAHHLAGQASAEGKTALLMDADPEANLTARFVENNPQLKDAPGLADALISAGLLNGDDDYDVEAGAEKLLEVIQETTWPGVKYIPAGKQLQMLSQMNLAGDQWMWLIREMFELAGLYEEFDLLMLDTAGRRGALVTMIMYACDVTFSPIHSTADSVIKAAEAKNRVRKMQSAHPLRWAGVVLTGFDTRAATNQDIRTQAYEAFGLLDENDEILEKGDVIIEIPYWPGVLHEAYQTGARLADQEGKRAKEGAKLFSILLNDHIFATSSPEGEA